MMRISRPTSWADPALLDEARQKYEATLPQLLAALQQQRMTEFADLKTPADIERLGREDRGLPQMGYAAEQIAEVTREILGAQGRHHGEHEQGDTSLTCHELGGAGR